MKSRYLLSKGDKVALVAPARKVSREEMEPFVELLKSWELEPHISENLYGDCGQFSGTDEQRAADFNNAWNNQEIKAIFCARGGYGSMRMLEHLNLNTAHPKLLIGYSDISTLQFYLAHRNIPSVHGPMAINAGAVNTEETKRNFELLHNFLFNGELNYPVADFGVLTPGNFDGLLTGGNLSLLYASLGTPEQPETKGKVLFIEEIDEYLYHIDRMVYSMRRAGFFDGINGVILGGFTDIKDNEKPFGQSIEEIFLEHLPDTSIPVIHQFPAGHGLKNFCMAMHVHCTFDGQFFSQKLI